MVSVMATCAHTTHIDTISSSFSYSSSSIVGERFSLSQSSQSVISFGRLPPSLCTSKKAPISTSSSSSRSAFRPNKEDAKSTSVDELHASFPVRSVRVAATAEQLFADINSIPSKGKPNLSFSLKSEPDRDDIINPRSDSEGLDISQIGLKDELAQSLLSRGIAKLFPIQAAVFRPAMEGRDIIGRAKTGTGKTLAFGIPIIQRLLDEDDEGSRMSRRFRSPRALLVAPTRELALQVEKEFVQTVPNLSIICVYGGVPISSQQRKLLRGVDVAVGTPGRIIDLIERGSLDLRNVKFVVLDEADQMLAVGFEEEVERILEELPPSRQSMLFSATIPTWVKKVSRKFLNNPLTIDLVGESDDKLAEGIKLYAVSMAASAKRSVLNDVITVYGKGGKTIVFTQTKRDADDIALSLSRMHGCEALHGDILQSQREKTLNAFRNGNFSVLVATDVAARGLDIPNVDLVIHFEIPNNPETFVHRSGRTGRAGKEGIAILMHTPGQQRTVKMIERDTGCSLERVGPPSVLDVLNASSEHAEEALKKVHPDLKSMFLKTAEKLIQEQGAYALAAAIAHLSGYTQPPPPRSLITHEQGFITLQVTRNRGPPLLSARRVMGALGDIYTEAVDNIGKIIIIDEKDVSGAVFDLPEDLARHLITKNNKVGSEAGLEIEVCTKLPRLMDDGPTSDMYGRFSSRSGGRDRGQRGYGSGKFSDSMDDEFNRNGRDKRFSRGRPENSEGRFNSRRSYSEGPFSGDCFICGESGHKASFCPKGRSASRRSY